MTASTDHRLRPHRFRDPRGVRRPGLPGPDRAGKANFDGNWSVLIVTEKGTCDRAYRYPVRITSGSVGYAGQASFNVVGRVGGNGAVTVTVSRGRPERDRHRPHVGLGRLRPLGDRLRRMLRLLDRRAPLISVRDLPIHTSLHCTSPNLQT